MKHELAKVISELAAPWVSNLWFFCILGVVSGDGRAGVISALGTSIVPMSVILLLMKSGRVGDHHVTVRSQRATVLSGIIVCVVVIAVVLRIVGAPDIIWSGVVSALVFLAMFSIVTIAMRKKASVHVGLWVCLSLFLAYAVHLWWIVLMLIAPIIAWSRVEVSHHSRSEVGLGAVIGSLVTVLCYLCGII